jgi:hypothetical protein
VPVAFGGWQSGFCRTNSRLDAFLLSTRTWIRKDVADPLVTIWNDMTRRRLVDRFGDLAEHLLDLLAHQLDLVVQ